MKKIYSTTIAGMILSLSPNVSPAGGGPVPVVIPVQQPTRYAPLPPIPLVPPPAHNIPYQLPAPGKQYWCGTSQHWYPEVQTCSIDWSLQHRIR
jgi:hypothetical protein